MKYLLRYCLLLFFISYGLQANAQYTGSEDLQYRPFRLSLIPGLSTNGMEAESFYSRYSLNILAGYNGALDRGVEIGGWANINKFYASGFQAAGIANFSGRKTSGIQLAGALNYSGRSMQGIQSAGIANVSRRDMRGIQLSGLTNISGGAIDGIQFSGIGNIGEQNMRGMFFAGILNVTGGNMQGLSFAGIGNFAENELQGIAAAGVINVSVDQQGIAAGPVNASQDMEGMQIGMLNLADEALGLQAGLLNIAKEFEGLPVGLISYYGNGRKNMDLWTSDGGFTNVGLKLGTEPIYNMISVGFNPSIGRKVWQLGWSIGGLREYSSYFRYSDFSIYKINEGGWTDEPNSILKYRYLIGKNFSNGFSIYGGPTVNLMISNQAESNDYTWYRLFDFKRKDKTFAGWVGYTIGVELF